MYTREETEIVMSTSDAIDIVPPTHWMWMHSDILIETDASSRAIRIVDASIDGHFTIKCDSLTQSLRRAFCFDARDEPHDPGTMCYIYRLTWFAMPIPLHESRKSNPTIRLKTSAKATDNGTITFTLTGGSDMLASPRSVVHADRRTFEIANEERNRKVWKIPIPKVECLRHIFCVCREDGAADRIIKPKKFSAVFGTRCIVEERIGIVYGHSSKCIADVSQIPFGCLRGDIPYWTGAITPSDRDFLEIHIGPTVSTIEIIMVITTFV
jgi:hypothetical protein